MPESFVDYPYGPTVDVIKNKAGKGFALLGILTEADIRSIKRNCDEFAPAEVGDVSVTVKCQPELINELRRRYAAVIPGYYSNKNHWNTIIVGKDCPSDELIKMINTSFTLVTK